jgi:ABC-type branched-subunit amino acid transport system substrate-binding protein
MKLRVLLVGLMVLLLVAVPLFSACSKPAPSPSLAPAAPAAPPKTTAAQATPTEVAKPAAPQKTVKFVVGINTGLTGGAAWCFQPQAMAVTDALKEANAKGLVPGIEFEIVEYDNQYQAQKTALGYRFCKDKGAKIIFFVPAQDVEGMLPLATEDKIVLLGHCNSRAATDTPSWAFPVSVPYEYGGAASIQSIVDMVWDYKKEGRPPNVGAIAWDNAMGRTSIEGAEAAIKRLGTSKINYIGKVIVPPGTIEYSDSAKNFADKKADFVISGLISSVAVPVLKLIQTQGYKYKMFWQEPGQSGWGMQIKQRCDPKEIVGHYWFGAFGWPTQNLAGYNELYKDKVLKTRTKEEIDKWVLLDGYEYGLGWVEGQMIIECVKKAAAAVGPEKITGDDLYKAMESITIDTKGIVGPSPLNWSAANYHTGTQVGKVYQINDKGDPVPISDWMKIERKL